MILQYSFTDLPCSCKNFVNANGYGNCQKVVPRGPLKGRPICYVVQPSGCSDLRGSKNNTGELVSAEACVGKDDFYVIWQYRTSTTKVH